MIEESKILKQNPKIKSNKTLLQVAVFDLFFGKKDSKEILKCYEKINHPLFAVIKKYYSELNASLVMIKIEKKVSKNEDLVPKSKDANSVILPRYIRVNTNKSTQEEVVDTFLKEGFIQSDKILEDQNFIMIDEHIPNLLVIPGSYKLHDHDLMTQGKIVIQDKASCFPSFALMDTLKSLKIEGDLVDACAAPGNKTSHIADLNPKKYHIHAFDKNAKRLGTLKALVKKLNLDRVVANNDDFLNVDPSNFPNVVGILVDPSCSGSGIHQEKTDESELKERLTKLSSIQTRLVQHAFRFPNVKVVVYSTCSIYNEENEEVVQNLLKNPEFSLVESILPDWKTRGKEEEFPNLGKHCLRAYPEEDLTRNGFFVAVFQKKTNKRKNESEESEQKKKKSKK
jgi:25S rRNA (cytosine2278-C5)-methyltransferase